MAFGRMMIPGATSRSPTAMQGQSDFRDDLFYSAIVIGHGGGGQQKLFTVPQGQAIPRMVGALIAPLAAHLLIHAEHSTNMDRAGEAGNSIGDAAVRGISLVLEAAAPIGLAGALGTYSTFGATPNEVCDFLSKSYFQLKVGGKTMTQGPVWAFPAMSGAQGSPMVTTDVNNTTLVAGIASNGALNGIGRRLKLPVQVARNDSISGVIGTPNGSVYAFSVQAGVGQCFLLTCMLSCLVRGDVR